ncbi:MULTISPECIES: L-lactate dehydrogenase (quinone) large subunit LdhH [unclassified Desulfovibrio]|uniref:L-lactate dehydrogenase (quinone) large subunit LdhH n=1 Tax=unclassified Desulfovibrio TaxID=2593640 RepID=UPI0013EA6D01|nr:MULTISPECIES: LUD domain-containing protein [unclassified Desulfovibrio]
MHKAPSTLSDYRKQIDEALGDEFLRRTLDTFAVAYKANREAVFKDVDERRLIEEIAAAKDDACQHMEELYEEFKKNAEKLGVHVHRAADAEDANRIIVGIAKKNHVKRVVKSKSMTAEEIQLNPALEKEGIIVDETDLGEWIIQLRHEGPSHMVMPAIHLSRYQVADNFEKETGEKQEAEDVQKLVKVARVQLRRKFIAADMGVSGCNFAIAENGAISTVTNEGNARMVETLAPIHVAVAGLDKLVPTLDVALTALQVLPRNATAQRLTAYVSLISGCVPCAVGPDGRKELHVVFLDNGRTEIAKDPLFSQIFRCVRCGACANVCPVFRLVGGHKMGYIYIGAIGLILTYFFHGKDKAKVLCQNCVGCESCANVCAGGIDLPRLIRDIRARCSEEQGSGAQAALLASVMKNRKLFQTLLRFASKAQKPFTGGTQFQRHLPNMFLGKHGFKALPALAPKAFRDKWESIRPRVQNPVMKVAIFGGCAQDFIYPEQLEAAVKIMGAKNVAVDFPMEQTCCGLPVEMMGERKTSTEIAKQNIGAFDPKDYDYIVTLCASCASHLKHVYPKLLENDPERYEAQAFADKIIDFSSFVRDKLGLKPEDFEKSGEKVTYHASCHLCRGLKVKEAPRELIADAAEYVPCEEEEVCCGFGGTYSMKFPEISGQLMDNKLKHIADTGAERLVVDCPGCVMQIKGGAEKKGQKIKVQHIAELLAENLKKD